MFFQLLRPRLGQLYFFFILGGIFFISHSLNEDNKKRLLYTSVKSFCFQKISK